MHPQTRIMIADDDSGILDSLSLLLQFEGYNVTTSFNGAELKDMSTGFPDVLLLDIWMSGTDGRDICKMLRTRELTKDLPIIMMSASADVRTSALDAGASDFLAKPFEMDLLITKIEGFVSGNSPV
jgi:DNA-binding response OmpR family regulator